MCRLFIVAAACLCLVSGTEAAGPAKKDKKKPGADKGPDIALLFNKLDTNNDKKVSPKEFESFNGLMPENAKKAGKANKANKLVSADSEPKKPGKVDNKANKPKKAEKAKKAGKEAKKAGKSLKKSKKADKKAKKSKKAGKASKKTKKAGKAKKAGKGNQSTGSASQKAEWFKKLDANSDGFLSLDEFTKVKEVVGAPAKAGKKKKPN